MHLVRTAPLRLVLLACATGLLLCGWTASPASAEVTVSLSAPSELQIPEVGDLTAEVVQDSPRVYPWVSIEDDDTGEQNSWCTITSDTYTCGGSFRAPWGDQLEPQTHHFYAQLWHVENGLVVRGPRSATAAIRVLPADLSIDLEASSTSVQWNDTVSVTATMNRDVSTTPYRLELWNQTTNQLSAWCTSGTSCSTSEWFNNIGLNDDPQPQNYVARLVRPNQPDGSISDVLTVDIRRRLYPIHMSIAAYNSGFRDATATTEEDDLPSAFRVVYRKANGNIEWACQFGQEECAITLRAGDAYRANVEDVHGHVFGRTPLYMIGADDPEALTGSDIDMGELATMLAPMGIDGVCTELVEHPELGTHLLGGTPSDQAIECEAQRQGGQSLLQILVDIAGMTASGELMWHLYHRGLEEQTETPPQDPDYPVPDPVRVPPLLPNSFDVDQLADVLLSQNDALTARRANELARTCLWLVSRANLNGNYRCRTLPIFASGSDVPEATQHDLEALASPGGAQWVQLNYRHSSETPGQRDWFATEPECQGAESGVTSCDEYPFWATMQGGPFGPRRPHLKVIAFDDNGLQGSRYGNFTQICHMTTGDLFLGIPLAPRLGIPTQTRICNGH